MHDLLGTYCAHARVAGVHSITENLLANDAHVRARVITLLSPRRLLAGACVRVRDRVRVCSCPSFCLPSSVCRKN
eukprot:3884747-Amphidinium_carterae.1